MRIAPGLLAAAILGLSLGLPGSARTAGRPDYGGVVTVAVPEVARAPDPATARDVRERMVVGLIHAGLLRYDAFGRIRPVLLVSRPERRDGGRVLDCELHRAATFHDGRPVTSRDVQWSIERLAHVRPVSPLAALAAVVKVRIRDRRGFALELVEGVTPDEVEALLAMPQAAIVPRGSRGHVGAGPFRPRAGGGPPTSCEAWLSAVEGRPFLDEVRFVGVAPGQPEAEAFHYGQLDVSFTDERRLSDRPAVDGPVVETLVVDFARRWQGDEHRAERAAMAALVDGAALSPHFDLPSKPPRRFLPDRGPRPAFEALAGVPPGGALTLVYRADAPETRDVAAALRDVLTRRGPAQALARSAADVPPSCGRRCPSDYDLLVTSIAWPPAGERLTASWAALWLGDDAGATVAGLPRLLARPGAAERALRAEVRFVPLLHFHRHVRHAVRLEGLRFDATGTLVLADAWWQGGAR